MIEIKIDTVVFKLAQNHDFTWLKELGKTFCAFDQQDSGNICFGVKKKDNEKIFVKYAGARTLEYKGPIDIPVARLKEAVKVYQDLSHPALIKLLDSFPVSSGFAVVFEWVDGDCLHDHWNFDKYPKYTHPQATYYRYKQLSIEKRLRSLDKIFQFHVFVEKNGYVADDFYDGSLIYNFEKDEIKICDIDFYKKKPHVNEMLWNSKRFNAPENKERGAILDEVTNVYNMGAAAFSLIGGELKRTIEKWEGSSELFQIARKATNEDRKERYQSVSEFYEEWSRVLGVLE